MLTCCLNPPNAKQEQWSALYDVRTVLLSIQSMLGGEGKPSRRFPFVCDRACSDTISRVTPSPLPRPHQRFCPVFADPNVDSPLNGHAASLWEHQSEYKRQLLKHYDEFVRSKSG